MVHGQASVRWEGQAMMRRLMRLTSAPLILLITSCSTFRPMPPTGLMWAYYAESETIPSLQILVYLFDRPSCEINRAKDIMKMPPSAAYAAVTLSAECRQVAVGSGTDYWLFAVPDTGAMGAKDRDWCLKLREGLAQTYPVRLGQCQPMGVRALP